MSGVAQRLWRRLPLPLRARVWRALDRLGARPVRFAAGPARGLTILVPASRRRAYRAGRYERPVLDALADLLQPGMEFVDVGAFLGYFTLAAAARVESRGRVWAFEPSAESRRLLERSVARNHLGNVTVVPLALGGSPGVAALSQPANPSMARLVRTDLERLPRVEVTTLDGWCRDSGARPSVMKIDVEGAELEVLAGAAETLRRHRPSLVIEAHHGPRVGASAVRLVEGLQESRYRVRPLTAGRSDDLAGALARLTGQSPPPGRVAILHLLASPR